jgi:DNA polymerase I-like protein with 3'-5' exonuclease and polymerase domains
MARLTIKDAYSLFHRGWEALATVERNGIKIDEKYLDNTITEVTNKIEKIESQLTKDKEIYPTWIKKYGRKTNFNSERQFGDILFFELGYPCTELTALGRPRVSEKSLRDVEAPFVKKFFTAKHLKKAVGTFLRGIKREVVNGYLHPFFHLHTAVSYRGSSSEINFMNLPRRDEMMAEIVRKCFITRFGKKGCILEFDFKALEVCIAACYTKDKALTRYIKLGKKADMHKDTSIQIYMLEGKDKDNKILRDRAKNEFVFREFYGGVYSQAAVDMWDTIKRLGDNVKLDGKYSVEQWLRHKGIRERGDCDINRSPVKGTFEYHLKKVERSFWHDRFVGYTAWKEKTWQKYLRQGYLDTLTGFHLEGVLTRNEVLNYGIQGSAFHCLLQILIWLQDWLTKRRMKSVIIGQIHDSMVMDVLLAEREAIINKVIDLVTRRLPQYWDWINVPLTIEMAASPPGGNWHDKKEIQFGSHT